jgi:16S rRNA (uracil1498-N3)-methyltransferase
MPIERFYSPLSFSPGTICTLEEEELRHLQVIRLRTGEKVELVNGKGALAQATLTTVEKRRALLTVNSVTHSSPGPIRILAQAIPRFNRLEFILEKGTELGATAFWLFPGERSEKSSFSENQKQRMTQLMIAAMKQCGRLDLPSIELHPSLLSWTPLPYPLLYGDTRQNAPTLKISPGPLILLIGPEGGLSPAELVHLDGPLAAQGLRLHSNILRTDTAAITLLAQTALQTVVSGFG